MPSACNAIKGTVPSVPGIPPVSGALRVSPHRRLRRHTACEAAHGRLVALRAWLGVSCLLETIETLVRCGAPGRGICEAGAKYCAPTVDV